MKKLLTIVTVLLCCNILGQSSNPLKDTGKTKEFSLLNWKTSELYTSGTQPLKLTQNPDYMNVYFYNTRFDNNEILKFTTKREIYFKPSAFCQCDSCKNYKGMKFLMNF